MVTVAPAASVAAPFASSNCSGLAPDCVTTDRRSSRSIIGRSLRSRSATSISTAWSGSPATCTGNRSIRPCGDAEGDGQGSGGGESTSDDEPAAAAVQMRVEGSKAAQANQK